MKLLICASEYYPNGSGIANVAYNVVEQLKKKGIKCTICSPTGPDIKIGSIGEYGRLSLLYFWYKVEKYFQKHETNYDIVWLHNPLFISKNPFNNFVVTIHSMPHGKLKEDSYSKFLHLYYTIASKIDEYCLDKIKKKTEFIVVDPKVGNELVKIGINEDQIINIPNGADLDLFKPIENKSLLRKRWGIPSDSIVLLSLGRVTVHKRPLELIKIFSELTEKIDNLTLIIGGDGELLGKAKKLAKEKSLDNIMFLGHVDHKNEAPFLYACSDYYILLSKYEGQPLTLLEALASGLKCIVSDIPNLRTIIENGNCGIVVDVQDENNATKHIFNYIKEDNLTHSLNARSYATQNFDWELIAQRYLEEFKKIS